MPSATPTFAKPQKLQRYALSRKRTDEKHQPKLPLDLPSLVSETLSLDITGMTCASCVVRAEKALSKVLGCSKHSSTSLRRKRSSSSSPEPCHMGDLTRAVEDAGYGVKTPGSSKEGLVRRFGSECSCFGPGHVMSRRAPRTRLGMFDRPRLRVVWWRCSATASTTPLPLPGPTSVSPWAPVRTSPSARPISLCRAET